MSTKKKNFAKVTANALRRSGPKSMEDFLSNNDDASPDETQEEQGRVEPVDESKPSMAIEGSEISLKDQPASEKILDLSEQTTFYLDLQVCEILDSLWLKLRQKAPKGRKKRISKSLIVNRMVEFCNETLERDGLDDSKLIDMILED